MMGRGADRVLWSGDYSSAPDLVLVTNLTLAGLFVIGFFFTVNISFTVFLKKQFQCALNLIFKKLLAKTEYNKLLINL